MHLAILGGTSQIARDLVIHFSAQSDHAMTLFARRPQAVEVWLANVGLSSRCAVADFVAFDAGERYDVILNFVGAGNPAQIAALGASILDITAKFDDMALNHVQKNPQCRYLFLSSGAAYGSRFEAPASEDTKASIAINDLQPQDWYAVAKLCAECRHRSLAHLPIVDIRVFGYFSRTQDISARFLVTDIIRAIRDRTVMLTSPDYIVRDFVHPSDFCGLVSAILSSPAVNTVVDCYSKAPIDKPALLSAMREKFGLRFQNTEETASINLTASKTYYYSTNTRAARFGYCPTLTSLDGILREAAAIFQLEEM